MNRRNSSLFMMALSAVILSGAGHVQAAGLGTSFTYQGRLTEDGSGANGTYDLRFSLFDQPVAGAQQGPTLCLDNIVATGGVFTVHLDFGSQFNGQERFLQIEVRADSGLDCANADGFIPLDPRQALTAAPNALFALKAGSSDGFRLPFSASVADAGIAFNVSNTGAGAAVCGSGQNTGVLGAASAATGTTFGGSFNSSSSSGRGVFGNASAAAGITYGVYGQSASTSGRAVFGSATASTGGRNYGGWFQSSGTTGIGVFGWATSSGSGTNYGLYGLSDSTSGRGLQGEASAGSGKTYGVYGMSASSDGRGVFGWASAATGTTYGGRFENASSDGRGVLGLATAASGNTYGVYGQSDSTSGVGVYGVANNLAAEATYGVYGVTTGTSGRGVYGSADASSGQTYGGYFRSLSSDGIGLYAYAHSGQPAVVADHILKVGSNSRDGAVLVHGVSATYPVLMGSANEHGGNVLLFDNAGHGVVQLKPSDNHSGGYFQVDRGSGHAGFVVNGNTGTEQPMVTISGSSVSAVFDMRPNIAPDDTVVLPEGSIRSPEIGDEPGVASIRRDTSALGEGITTLVTHAIIAPAAGYVLAIGTATAGVNHPAIGGSWARFGLGDTNSVPYNVDLGLDPNMASGEYRCPVAVHGLFAVSAGPKEISFVGQEINSSWGAFDINLTLIYFPTAYGSVEAPVLGAASTLTAPAATQPADSSNLPAKTGVLQALDPVRMERELAEVKARLTTLESLMQKPDTSKASPSGKLQQGS